MSSVLDALGIDPDELKWQDLVACNQMDINLFFDDYEADENVAKMIDEACLSCPVMAQCLKQGMDNGEWGVWGGIFLTSGKPDKKKNAHKTPEVWDEIRSRIID